MSSIFRIFRKLGGLGGSNDESVTFRPLKTSSLCHINALEKNVYEPLLEGGSERLRKVVERPEAIHINECEKGACQLKPGEGFPPGFEYKWVKTSSVVAETRRTASVGGLGTKNTATKTFAARCTGVEYIHFAMDWIDEQMDNFPTDMSLLARFNPEAFGKKMEKIFSRLFRIWAIIYTNDYKTIEVLGLTPHINTSIKHFLYFVFEHKLIPEDKEREFLPLKSLVASFKTCYEQDGRNGDGDGDRAGAGAGAPGVGVKNREGEDGDDGTLVQDTGDKENAVKRNQP